LDLDRAATSPLRVEAKVAMEPFLADRYGNPSASHALGRDAVRALDEAREVVADILGCSPSELVFTSGGTESDVHAVTGGLPMRSGRALCTAVEHPAVLRTVRALGGSTVSVHPDGRVDLDALAEMLDAWGVDGAGEAPFVSVMSANNELGTINDLGAVAAVLDASGIRVSLHTDAVQAAPWLDVSSAAARADLVSISAHKFGGPKGVGALVVRSGTPLRPLLPGGGQEWGLRSGTTNVAGVVGMAAALAAVARDRVGAAAGDGNGARVAALRDRLAGRLCALEGVGRTVPAGTPLLPGTLHLIVDGVESEPLLFLLDEGGVNASAASACASGAATPSHVLDAIGVELSSERPRAALRLSLGHDVSEDQIEFAAGVVIDAIFRLRAGAALTGGRA